MEGIPALHNLLQQGDWLGKVDLKDAYFSVSIHMSHQQFLRFTVEEVDFQFTSLPFGLSCASWDIHEGTEASGNITEDLENLNG